MNKMQGYIIIICLLLIQGLTAQDNHAGHFEGESGVYARGTGALKYGGEFHSDQYRGLYASSSANFYDAYFGNGAGISTSAVINRSSANRSLAINLGDFDIQQGDIVALAGVFSSEHGNVMLGVEKVNDTNQNAVIGIADGTIVAQKVQQENGTEYVNFSPTSGTAKPKNYLTIITNGLAPAVNIGAISRSVELKTGDVKLKIGDKITLSSTGAIAGSSNKISNRDQVVIGKVAGPIDVQNGTIPLFINID